MKLLNRIFVFLVIFLFITPRLYAKEYFSDTFDYKDETKWKYDLNSGKISFSNSVLELRSEDYFFPFVTNSVLSTISNVDPQITEFKFKYSSVGSMGTGLGIGYTGINNYPYYLISVWNDTYMGPVLQYQDSPNPDTGRCDYYSGIEKKNIFEFLHQDGWNILSIRKTDNNYLVYLNDSLILNLTTVCVADNIFVGNPLSGGSNGWSGIDVDYIKVFDEYEHENNKIILIPGLGASWNAEAMLIGSTTLDSGWKMTPFVKNYDKLVDTFEDKGLVRDQDFFVWNYDWRKPLSEIVTDFNNFIYGLNLGENDKLYLVGHSLGGMVARIWSQDNPLKVEKVISLGSPHYGSVKAYEAWNGVKVSDSVDFSSIALNIFLRLKSSNGENSVKVLREFAPIVLDLNPTFSFLRKNGQDLKSTSFSYYLELQNQNIAPILGKLKTVDGVGEETKSILNLGERSLFDKVLQIWEQGRPISSVNDVGDGTVLKKSALIGGTSGSEYQSKHGDLVDKSVDYIMNEFNLGVSPTSSMMRAFSLENEHNLLVFYSDINGTLQVNCSGIEKSAVDGFVWFENVDSNSCRVKMLASETGKYRLLAEGEKTIDLNLDLQKDQEREISLSGGDGYWLALEEYSSILGANNMAIGVANRDISMTIDEYIRFRQVNKNIKYGEEILTGMRYILSQKSYSQIETNTAINNAAKSKSLVESNLRLFSRSGKTPSIYAASTYDLAENMVKFKDYSGAILADKLYKIVWK